MLNIDAVWILVMWPDYDINTLVPRKSSCYLKSTSFNKYMFMIGSCGTIIIMIGQHFGAGNSLVPGGTKPLPDPMLTQSSDATWHHKAKMS